MHLRSASWSGGSEGRQLLDRRCDGEVRATDRVRHHEALSQFALKIFAVCTTAQRCSVTCLHRRLDTIKGVSSADGGVQTVRTEPERDLKQGGCFKHGSMPARLSHRRVVFNYATQHR